MSKLRGSKFFLSTVKTCVHSFIIKKEIKLLLL